MVRDIRQQIDRMRDVWSRLTLVARDSDSAIWEGPITPLLQTYQVSIFYRAPRLIENLDARRLQPRVSVISPHLRPRLGDKEGMLPHVYYSPEGKVTLCLLDPDAADWSPADLLAETTVPWTIEWLAAYDGWRASQVGNGNVERWLAGEI